MGKKTVLFSIIFLVNIAFIFGQQLILPEYYGAYLVTNGKVVELVANKVDFKAPNIGGSREEIISGIRKRSDINTNDEKSYIIIYYENAIDFRSIKLTKLQYANKLALTSVAILGETKKVITPINMWVQEKDVPFKVAPIENKRGMYKIVPSIALAPGVYAIHNGCIKNVIGQGGIGISLENIEDNSALDFSVNFEQYQKNPNTVQQEMTGETRSGEISAISRVDTLQGNGMNYINNGQYEQAEKEFRNALSIQISQTNEWTIAKSHFGLGLALAYQHKFEGAINEFKSATNIQPNFADPYYSLASIFSLQSEIDTSINYLEISLKKGFNDFKFMNSDTDLDNIKDDPRYIKLMKSR